MAPLTKDTSPGFETIVCAMDFSEPAERALEAAIRFARRHSAELVVAHVVEPIPLGPYPILQAPGQELEIEALARARVAKTVDDLAATGLSVRGETAKGQPGPTLIEIVERLEGDLVVIATRGLTGLKSLALGSTAEYVVRRCPCPVLTIHPDDEIIKGPLERVLLPTDLSGDSMRAAEVFVSLFGPWERPEITLFYADRTPPYMDPFRHDILARLGKPDPVRDKILAQMEPFEKLLRAADFEVQKVVADGDPVNATADYAERENMDLVLIATHGRSALANILMGRTAQRIVQSAPCPVLSVPTRAR